MGKRFLILSILALILVNAALYAKTAGFDFVNLDDTDYVINNPLIKEFDYKKLKILFTEEHLANYQPLVHLTYAAEYSLFGLDPGKFHLTNALLHVINSILLFLLIYIVTKKERFALLIALFFAVHPIQVESVAWISERKGLMCTFFYLLAFMSYVRFTREGKRPHYFLCIVLFLCALLSKPMAVTFPLILILFDYYSERLDKSALIEKVPFVVLSGIFSVITVLVQDKGGAVDPNRLTAVFKNFLFAFYNIGFYLSKLVNPVRLSADYEYIALSGGNYYEYALAVIVMACIVLWLINFKKISRSVNFGVAFFLISIIPILRFVPIGHTFSADRYMYVPMIGFFLSSVCVLNELSKKSVILKRMLIGFMIAYFVYLGALSYSRCEVWRESTALWESVLDAYPGYYNANLALGNIYMQSKDYPTAIKYLKPLLDNPKSKALALYSLGEIYFFTGEYGRAEQHFTTLLMQYPRDSMGNNTYAWMYLGHIKFAEPDYIAAEKHYNQSLELNPNNYKSHYGYAKVLEKTGNIDAAISRVEESVRINPNWEQSANMLKRLKAIP